MPTLDQATHGAIDCRIDTAFARHRVAQALHEVTLDSLAYGPRDLPTQDDREWIRGAIAIPIQEATDIALSILADRLTLALERAPSGLRRRCQSSHLGQELGWE
jgi:hypothetical protein